VKYRDQRRLDGNQAMGIQVFRRREQLPCPVCKAPGQHGRCRVCKAPVPTSEPDEPPKASDAPSGEPPDRV